MTGLDASALVAGAFTFRFAPYQPLVMGIVNTNPGSFSDSTAPGGFDDLLARALAVVDAGADIVDIGFDSGVTYNAPIPASEQIAGGVPLVAELARRGVPVSLDTPNPDVARAGLDAGAVLLNDVSGLAEPALAELAAEFGAALCVLHTRAPHKVEHFPDYAALPSGDVVQDVVDFIGEQIDRAAELGVPAERIVVDPGFDYAKRPHETVAVIQAIDRLDAFARPYLFGVSRKYFAGIVTGAAPADRLPETLATIAYLRRHPGFVRVHDVAIVRRFLDITEILDGATPFPPYDQLDDDLKWVRP